MCACLRVNKVPIPGSIGGMDAVLMLDVPACRKMEMCGAYRLVGWDNSKGLGLRV